MSPKDWYDRVTTTVNYNRQYNYDLHESLTTDIDRSTDNPDSSFNMTY